MKVVAVVYAVTQNQRKYFSGAAPLGFEFGGRPLLGIVLDAVKQIAGIDETWFVPPADATGDALRRCCAAAGVHYYEATGARDRVNAPLQAAVAAGADHALLVAGTALFLDPILARQLLERHLAGGAARTQFNLPPGLAPQVIALGSVKQAMAQFGLDFDDEQWVLRVFQRDPQRFSTASLDYPGGRSAGRLLFNCFHSAQVAGLGRAWAAVGGRGVAALFEYGAAHPEDFSAFPNQVQVELTSRCNHHCVFCPHDHRAFAGDLDPALFERVLEGLDWNPAAGIDLAGYGEPMLHPRFWELLDRAVRRGIEVHLYTNGTQWAPGTAARLLESGVKGIIFGIDAATPATYRAVRGADGLEAVTANVNELLRLKKGKTTPIVAVQIVKSKLNNDEIEAFWEKWSLTDKFERMRLADYDFQAASGQLRLHSIELERADGDPAETKAKLERLHCEYHTRYWDAFYRHAELPLEHVVIQRCNDFAGQLEDRRVVDFTPLKRFPCRQVGFGLMVLADGAVVPCQQDFNATMTLGNLRDTDLVTLWNSEPMRMLQGDQREGRFTTRPLCATCRDWFIPMI